MFSYFIKDANCIIVFYDNAVTSTFFNCLERSSCFAEYGERVPNKDNNKLINKNIPMKLNEHLSEVVGNEDFSKYHKLLQKIQSNTNSTRHKSQNGETRSENIPQTILKKLSDAIDAGAYTGLDPNGLFFKSPIDPKEYKCVSANYTPRLTQREVNLLNKVKGIALEEGIKFSAKENKTKKEETLTDKEQNHLNEAINKIAELSKQIKDKSLEDYKSIFKNIDPTQYNILSEAKIDTKNSETDEKNKHDKLHKICMNKISKLLEKELQISPFVRLDYTDHDNPKINSAEKEEDEIDKAEDKYKPVDWVLDEIFTNPIKLQGMGNIKVTDDRNLTENLQVTNRVINNAASTRHKSQSGKTHNEEKSDFMIESKEVMDKLFKNGNRSMNGLFVETIRTMIDRECSKNPAKENKTKKEETLADKKQNHFSTRHKSQNGQTHNENNSQTLLNILSDATNTGVYTDSFKQQMQQIFAKEIKTEEKDSVINKEEDKWVTPKDFFEKPIGVKQSQTTQKAYKETDGKLYYELDWGFIKQMAERMESNKKEGKYEMFNWKKPMTFKGIEELKQAALRHLIEVLEGKYEDDGRPFGHIEAISDNMMMINFQLKNGSR